MVLLMLEDISLRKMASLLGIQVETAFRWRHRALALLCLEPRSPLTGCVNVSSTLVQYSEKGRRTCNGPGSWGYWDWLRRGDQPDFRLPHPDMRRPWPQPQRPRFRRLIDGRPTTVIVAETGTGYEVAVLGQVRMTVEDLVDGLQRVACPEAELYTFALGSVDALRAAGLNCHDGFRTPVERGADGGSPRRRRVFGPGKPNWWLRRFRGVATRYLEHYLAWYRDIVHPATSAARAADAWPRLLSPVA